MNKIITLFMLLFLSVEILAQSDSGLLNNDTVFYMLENGFINKCDRIHAVGFSILPSGKAKSNVNEIYYLQTGTLMAEYEFYYESFSKNRVKATYPIKNGKYEEWYLSGEKRVSCNYTEDKLNGEFKVFYRNGKLKRLEQWKNGDWEDGKCFDEFGNEVQYCSYHEMAEFSGGLSELFKFVSKNLQYPRYAVRKGIEGIVYVNFIIATDGSVVNAKIEKGVESHLNDEALRIINKMPKWRPAKFEGNPIESEFMLPITFRLR